MGKIRIGVLISGSGTNLQSIIDACKSEYIPGEVVVVISNREDAYGRERARQAGIPEFFISHKGKSREDFEKELIKVLDRYKVDLVTLAGFMRVLSPYFVKYYSGRLMNIHPALLPAFPGINVQEKQWEYGVKIAGCTVHFVDEGTDTGPIIIQAAVPVYSDDEPEDVRLRILEEEHKIYPLAIKLFAEGRLTIKGRRVIIQGERKKGGVLINPSE